MRLDKENLFSKRKGLDSDIVNVKSKLNMMRAVVIYKPKLIPKGDRYRPGLSITTDEVAVMAQRDRKAMGVIYFKDS
jgi:hypothetical protein